MPTVTPGTDAGSLSPPIHGRAASALAVVWQETGRVGRIASIGLALSAVVAVVLGFSIDRSVRHHVIDVRAEVMQRIIDGLARDGLLPTTRTSNSQAEIDLAIEHRLIGGETVAVAIRDSAGTVVYGDAEDSTVPADVALPHREQHADGTLHFRLPVREPDRTLAGTFDVVQQARSFQEVVGRIRRNVWLSISSGLGTLAVAMGALGTANARALDERRRHAERLLGQVLRAGDAERARVVGSLHDDVGQPLYRVLYGLEGCAARLGVGSAVRTELESTCDAVRDIERSLRQELQHLHRTPFDALELVPALEAIARRYRDEDGLDVRVDARLTSEPSLVARSVLLRAVQEALVNVAKHADARSVQIRVHDDRRGLVLEVHDDGCGATGPWGLGLTITAERLLSIGGALSLGPSPSGGTTFRAQLPPTR